MCVCVCPRESRNKSGVTGWGGGCLPGWHSPTESQSVHFGESEMLGKEGGDTAIEASGSYIQIIWFGFSSPFGILDHFTTRRMMERKESKMSHACRMNNVQGSWCYVIFCSRFCRQPPSLSLSSLSSSSERITRDTLWVVELNIDSSKGPGSLTNNNEKSIHAKKLIGWCCCSRSVRTKNKFCAELEL